jgi:acyl carrier protein
MRVEAVVARVLNVDPSDVNDQSSNETMAEWDSMAHLSLIAGLEEEFKVSLAVTDALEMTSVLRIKQILTEYGVSP